ncbi:hypothetical protein C2S53_014872 [Perilla frutescens var. hirtella]|uniref:Uncharacterized protein n=1 Tax=Perilla frutescens var. hirtella TaxID=608512 RepID=A0AAD4J7B2_PERFH|nr:hypothetical protein C2S53_014872 [Perilla frutescens var. hirtella]
METCGRYPHVNSSPRAAAMVLALVSAIVLSPLYVDHRKSESLVESRWSSSGLVLPAVVVGLIAAIKTTTSSNNAARKRSDSDQFESADNCNGAAFLFRIGSSSLGLAGILIMLLFVISWR